MSRWFCRRVNWNQIVVWDITWKIGQMLKSCKTTMFGYANITNCKPIKCPESFCMCPRAKDLCAFACNCRHVYYTYEAYVRHRSPMNVCPDRWFSGFVLGLWIYKRNKRQCWLIPLLHKGNVVEFKRQKVAYRRSKDKNGRIYWKYDTIK